VNQRVAHISLSSKVLTPEYTVLVLNTIIGQSQLLREMTIADTVGHITNENVRDILVPRLNTTSIAKITASVKASFQRKDHSKHLLFLAKRAVETAIESGEAAGVALLAAEGA
jgi:hypothetical protein